MACLSRITDRDAVIQAIAECERLGQEQFLERYGFGAPREYFIRHHGKLYPSKAIMGVAYGKQHPSEGPLRPEDFSGGRNAAARRVVTLDFDVVHLQNGLAVSITNSLRPTLDELLDDAAAEAEQEGHFDPHSIYDARNRVRREIVQRRGQRKFREKLLKAYGYRCAICGCDCVDVLEAAHVPPYLDGATNHITNGMLLRGDLHTLFDLQKIAFMKSDGPF
jgi:hypothetical protein